MNAQSDPQLLCAFAERRSEAAFAELVRRHIDFVHSAAVRMVNDPHLAQDVSQGVFVALAKDAGKLTDHPVLSGWLHRTARNIAAQTVRTEVRRRTREKEAAVMNASPETDASWEVIAPQLDAALADLSEPDRDAVLLRYFENKSAQEMATILGITAEAAQKRVSRAVEKLRESFATRGITAGAAGIAGVISANAVQAAPAGLAATVSSTAIAGTVTTAKILAVTTIQKSLLAAVVVLTGLLVLKSRQLSEVREEVARLRDQVHAVQRQQGETGPRNRETGQTSERHADDSHAAFAVMASGKGDGEVYTEEQVPAISYVDGGGTLSSALMTKFGLSKEQFAKTQGVVSAHWGGLASWAAEAIFYDEAGSKAAPDGASIYRLPAMEPILRQEVMDKFSQDLLLASNNAAARAVIAGLQENISFAYMGNYDVVFRFTQQMSQALDPRTNEPIGTPTPIPDKMTVSYQYITPKSGKVVLKTSNSSLESASERFGNIFQPGK